jgi:uncharacterized protein YprB with RNaseH-like and TPR domain
MNKLRPEFVYCVHHHNGISHSECYKKYLLKSNGRVGFLDIETSNLQANFGLILSYAIKTAGKNEFFTERLTRNEFGQRKYLQDREIVKHLIKDMKKYDIICGYYSARFDIPYIRSRALRYNIKFPSANELRHIDLYFTVKKNLRLNSNRLATVSEFLGVPGKTIIKSEYWVSALSGDETSLKYIQNHNLKDVIVLEKVFNKMQPYFKLTNRSI